MSPFLSLCLLELVYIFSDKFIIKESDGRVNHKFQKMKTFPETVYCFSRIKQAAGNPAA